MVLHLRREIYYKGVSVAASARNGGHDVYWASQGRSSETRARAEAAGLHDLGDLARLCERCSVIISVCPPHAAEEVADQVLRQGYAGLYLDANAISPRPISTGPQNPPFDTLLRNNRQHDMFLASRVTRKASWENSG